MMKNIVVECQKMCYNPERVIVLQGGEPPAFLKWQSPLCYSALSHHGKYGKREVMCMSTYEVLSLLFLGGTFLITLLVYIDRNNKRK